MKISKNRFRNHEFIRHLKTLLIFLLISSSPTAFGAGPVNLTPETTGIISKNGNIPFYANFANSDDGRVNAQVFFNEDSHDIFMTYSNDWGFSWVSKKLDNSNFGQPSVNILVSGDGSTISVFWNSGGWERPNSILKNIYSLDSGKSWTSAKNIIEGLNVQKMSTLWSSISQSGSSQIITLVTNNVTCGNCDPQELYILSTSNSGETWNSKKSKAINLQQLYGDVIISNDGTRMAYIYESFGNPNARGHFNMAISLDSGLNWTDEWIAIQNPSGSQGLKFIYLNANKIILSDMNSEIQISTDAGKNFQKTIKLPGFLPDFVVSDDGMRILAVTAEVSSSGRNVNFSSSTDGGLTWSQKTTLTSIGRNSNVITASSDMKTIGIVWSNWVGNAVYLQTSPDSGKTWSAAIELIENDHIRLGAVGYRMDSLILDQNRKRFFFAYEDVVLIPYTTTSLRGVEVPLFNLNVYESGNNTHSYLIPSQAKVARDLLPVNLVKEHNKFLGWSFTQDGPLASLENLKIESDLNLYALWQELPKYNLEYVANDVLLSVPPSQNFWTDQSMVIEQASSLKSGFVFKEWNTKSDGSGERFLPGDKRTSLNSNLKLFAIADKITSINCIKGKLIKKVTAVKPKCPSGYTLKK